MLKKGLVLFGINNIYTVQADGSEVLCRIKGKKLDTGLLEYNPLAPGDWVEVEVYGRDGMIVSRLERKNSFNRLNRKNSRPQALAANLDLLVIVSCVNSPPFRPRFLDRVLVSAGRDRIKPLIVLNKIDLGMNEEDENRAAEYQDLGIDLLPVSVVTGEGLDVLKELLQGKLSAFVGQSGVGKSSLINALFGDDALRTGAVSKKFNRGIHTTIVAKLLNLDHNTLIIDTPGVREIDIFGIDSNQLQFYFPEMDKYRSKCPVPFCSHLHEPGCRVIWAVEKGRINEDRYLSYQKIFDVLKEQEKNYTT